MTKATNNVRFEGRLTKDVEVKYFEKNGQQVAVANFDLAVKRPFTKDTTDFFRIVTYRGQAEACAKVIGKGWYVSLIGYIQIREFETQEGQKRTVTEIVADDVNFIKAPQGNGNNNGNNGNGNYNNYYQNNYQGQGQSNYNNNNPAPQNPAPSGNAPAVNPNDIQVDF